MMGISENNICDEIENVEHVILKCDKFSVIRNKYKTLSGFNNLTEILNKNDLNYYKEIDINYNIFLYIFFNSKSLQYCDLLFILYHSLLDIKKIV